MNAGGGDEEGYDKINACWLQIIVSAQSLYSSKKIEQILL
jgi:hypothetical protein